MSSIYDLFCPRGTVVELRGIDVSGKNPGWEGFAKKIVSGYYDNAEAFDKGVAILDKVHARGIYFTINPVNPALIARASNRLKVPKSTTQDTDIVCIRWLPIDLDPKRPADISSTDAEVAAAVAKGKAIAAWLEEEIGFKKGIRAYSGNGCHLVYRLSDLPNNEETHKSMVAAIAAIKAKFDDDQVSIDSAVVNPARIWKCYGTVGRKGDATSDRPHRKSSLFSQQPAAVDDLPITETETFLKLAALAIPPAPTKTSSPTAPPRSAGAATRFKESTLGPIDMERYLTHYGVGYTIKQKGAQTLYCLDHCLFNPDHDQGQASIITSPTGPLIYQCFHDTCKDKKWKDAKVRISGDKKLAEFCAGFDPNWKPTKQVGTGMMQSIQVAPDLQIEPASLVEPPEKMDPLEFFEKRGKRPVFVPAYLVKYLASYLHPLAYSSGTFLRYKKGVWSGSTETLLNQIMWSVMKDRSQSDMLNNTMKLLKAAVNKEEDVWPKDENMINVANGMLDIRTMALVPHDPKYGSRSQLPVNYNEKAFSQRWWDFLIEIFPDDENYAKRGILQQFFGYCLLRDCRYQKALFLYGTGANGKSTVLDVLQAMVGRENTSSLSLADLTQRFKAQFLRDKLINMATETNTRDPLATELLKAIIAGDPITAEQKYGEQFQFRPYAKFITAMNDAPVIPDKSYGFGRRIIVLTFEKRFTEEEIKPRMADYLIEEIEGIFNWAVDGLKALLKNDVFKVPDKVGKATSDFMEEINPLLIFVKEMCEVHDKAAVPTMELWECYVEWCADGKNRPLGRNRFLGQVNATFRGVERKLSGSSRIHTFMGIGLTHQAQTWMVERKARFRRREEN